MHRLLMVTTVAGTHKAFLLPFARYFREKGWQVDGMSLNISKEPECLATYDRVWDVDFARNPFSPENIFVAPKQIQKILTEQEYDIIHLHTAVASFVTRTALKGLKQKSKPKIIYTIHGFNFYRGGNPLTNAAFLFLEKLVKSETDYAIVINREDEEAAKRLFHGDRVRYIPGIGVDKDYYNPNALEVDVERVRQELGLKPEERLFLSVAALNQNKRPQDLLQAFARLNQPLARLAFAGDGPRMDELKLLAKQLGIEKQVHFLGLRKDIPSLMSAAVATLLVSKKEGLPRCLMESLCLETPAIGSNIRGTRDLIKDGCGLLVEVGDVEGIAAAMSWILDHPEEARLMGKRGRDRMSECDLRQIIKLHESLYAEAIIEKTSAGVSNFN